MTERNTSLKTLTAIVLVLVGVASSASAQSLTPMEISSAIAQGMKDKKASASVNVAKGYAQTGVYTVDLDGPFARIVDAAAAAAQKYLPFTTSDVTEEMRAETMLLTAYPPTPVFSFNSWSIAPLAEHVVLQAKGKSGPIIQPIKLEPFPVSWSNAVGGQFEGQGLSATFDLKSLPPGPFDVVLVFSNGKEHRYTLKDGERKRIK